MAFHVLSSKIECIMSIREGSAVCMPNMDTVRPKTNDFSRLFLKYPSILNNRKSPSINNTDALVMGVKLQIPSYI